MLIVRIIPQRCPRIHNETFAARHFFMASLLKFANTILPIHTMLQQSVKWPEKRRRGGQKNEKTQHFWHTPYLVKVKENPDVILLKVCDNLIQLDNIVHIILPLRYNYESIPLGETRHAF